MISATTIPGDGRVSRFTDHLGSQYLCGFQNPKTTDFAKAGGENFPIESVMGQKAPLIE